MALTKGPEGTDEAYEISDTQIQDVTDLIGSFGRVQKYLITLTFYIGIFSALNNLNLPFLAPKVDHWCSRSPDYVNISVEQWKNISIPLENKNGKSVRSSCEIYDMTDGENNTVTRPILPCKSWEYDHSIYQSTIEEKWDLVCENSWLVSLAGSVYFFGFMVTAFVSGQLSDRFGRRPVLLACVVLQSTFGIMCVFSPSYWIFAASRFLLSVGRAGIFLTGYVLVMEAVGAEYRRWVGIADMFGWGTGQMLLAGIAWILNDWYYIQLMCTIPVIILASLWWFLPESPRWQLSHGKLEEAEKTLKTIMKINGKDTKLLSSSIQKLACNMEIAEKYKDSNGATFLDLLRNIHMLKITLVLYFVWMVNIFAFYGLAFNAEDIGGNLYLYFFLSGLMDYPAAGVMHLVIDRIGRRYPLMASMIITGVACLLTTAVPDDMTWLRVALAVASRFCLSTSVLTIYILTSEIYPTVVRNVGVGSCSMMGRFGAIVAPFMKEASQMVHWALPFAIFGIMSITAGVMTLVLPETKDKQLLDSLGNQNSNCDANKEMKAFKSAEQAYDLS